MNVLPMLHDSAEWFEILSSLVDNAPDYIVVVDREHHIRFCNRLEYGLQASEVIGARVETFAPREDRVRIGQAIDSVFSSGDCASYEYRVVWRGREYWFSTRLGPVLEGGIVAYVTLITTDVTEQRAAAEDLRQSEERFRTLVQHAPEAITILDVDSRKFTMVNAIACELFGLGEAELLTKGPVEVSPPSQPDGRPSSLAAREFVQAAMAGEEPAFEWVHLHKDGHPIPCEIRLVRLPDPYRKLVRGSILDISERKRAEKERERIAERLLNAQKMEALGQLTGGVAHDFNNLLTVILGNLELVRRSLGDRPDLLELTDMATTAGRHASSLTQRLLAFSRKQPLAPVVVDLNQLIRDMRGLLIRTLGEAVEVVTFEQDDLWSCKVDPNQMESAILNLALNARDAMPTGGRLILETSNVILEAGVTTEELAPGCYVELSVVDEGEGMTPEVLGRALEPFFTTKGVGRGSGLGLSMAYGFVRQSGGGLDIVSRPGQGTTVRIRLPRVREPAAGRVREGPGLDEPRGHGERVLVVEDEERLRRLSQIFLEGLGYQPTLARDGPSALAILGGEEIDVLFCDVVLPGGMNGFELARAAREIVPGLPVLYTSGYAAESILDEGRLDAQVDLLAKPFTRAMLAQRLRSVLP